MKFTDIDLESICIQAIKEYLNRHSLKDEEVKSKYRVALMVAIEEAKKILENKSVGISSITQGSQNVSYDNSIQAFKVSDNVKALLPKSALRLF